MLGFSDVGSTPTTSTIYKSGIVRHHPKALDKSRAFLFVLSVSIHFDMFISGISGGIYGGIPPKQIKGGGILWGYT